MAERQARLARVQPAPESRVIDLVTTIETEGFDQLVTVQFGDFRAGFGKISPVSSFTPALRYEQPRLGRTELSLQASGAYSVTGYQAYNFKLGIFDEPAPADFLGAGFLGAPFDFDQRSQRPTEGFIYADLGFRGFPDEILYGLGSDADESSRSEYKYEESAFDVVGGYQFARWVGVQARAGLLTTNVTHDSDENRPDAADRFDDTGVPGIEHQPGFFHFDSGLYLGWEADPNDPAALLGVRFARFDELDGSRFQFNRFSLDVRGFLPLGSRQRTIAVRYYVSRDSAADGSEVPFYLMKSVVAWIGAEMEFALSQAVASGDTFEHRPAECGHCVQDFLADLDLRDLPGEAAGSELGADDALPPADLRFYPAALVVPCGHLPGHAAVAADLGNMAIPNGWIPRRLRADHCVLWRRYNHIQGLPIPFPQQIPCGRSIIGAVSQKARDRGIHLIQEPG